MRNLDFGSIRLRNGQRKKFSMTSRFLTWAVGWMVVPFMEVRNLRGRCLEGKDEELKIGHAAFQVPEHLMSFIYRPSTQKRHLAEVVG